MARQRFDICHHSHHRIDLHQRTEQRRLGLQINRRTEIRTQLEFFNQWRSSRLISLLCGNNLFHCF